MSAIPAGSDSFVLLTGASGFLATHIGLQLLQRGFRVRGTVRSPEKGEYLDKLYAAEGLKGWEWVNVEDVEKDGAFLEAVKGVDAILHTASPFHYVAPDPWKDMINPAVNGTLALLNAATTEPKIKRVVITSSFAAITEPKPDDPTYVFTEKDWNEVSTKTVNEKGADAPGFEIYRASKTEAEKAAWKFIEEGKAAFDISTVNPPLIFGPILHDCRSPKSLNTSILAFYNFLIGAKKDEDAIAVGGNYVDVRDVAQFHIDALITEGAANQRLACCADRLYYQDILDLLHTPEHKDIVESFPKIVRGLPGTKPAPSTEFSAAKAKKIFNWEPIPFEKTIVDMAKSLAERQKEW